MSMTFLHIYASYYYSLYLLFSQLKKVKKVVDKSKKMIYYEHMNRCSYVTDLNLTGVEGYGDKRKREK